MVPRSFKMHVLAERGQFGVSIDVRPSPAGVDGEVRLTFAGSPLPAGEPTDPDAVFMALRAMICSALLPGADEKAEVYMVRDDAKLIAAARPAGPAEAEGESDDHG